MFLSGSCPEFGVSGSGIVREWEKRIDATGPALDEADPDPNYRYSFVGPLSMSKGCDLTADFSANRKLEKEDDELGDRIPEFVYRGKLAILLTFLNSQLFQLGLVETQFWDTLFEPPLSLENPFESLGLFNLMSE